MSFTDQKPRKATEQQVTRWGGSREAGKRFRCYLCGYTFKIGDYWRCVSGTKKSLSNFIVCETCDCENVLDRWVEANRIAKEKYWWFTE